MNSLFYPFIDPVTGLPIIDPGIMAQLDPNALKRQQELNLTENKEETNYETFQQSMIELSQNSNNYTGYKLDDYNDPLNYNLYYQSLYQMYPQMSDVSLLFNYFN